MRRAYVEAHVPLRQATRVALEWAGKSASIRVPNTRSVDDNQWLAKLGIPITSPSAKSRFYGRPRGVVIGFGLNLSEILEVERCNDVEGIVAVQAFGPFPHTEGMLSFAPWITAFDVECLEGEPIGSVPEASSPIKAAVQGLTSIAVSNQGLLDDRERSAVVQTLMYLRGRGVGLEPDSLMVEALRNEWGGSGPEELRKIAIDLNRGRRLQFRKRLREEALEEWLHAT